MIPFVAKHRGAFFRFGSFSHINAAVLSGLRKSMPECEIVEFDLRPRASADLTCLIQASLETLIAKPGHLLNPDLRVGAILRTKATRRRLSQYARELADGPAVTPQFTLQTQSLFDAKLAGVPNFIYTDHTHLANLSYPSFRREDLMSNEWIAVERATYLNADAVFVMSEHVRNSLLTQYQIPDQKIINVGVGIHTNPRSDDMRRRDGKRVLFVGVDWARKGGAELIEACDLVYAQMQDLQLVVVGCSPNVRRPYLDVRGRITLPEIADELERANLFCMPSHIEPFGIAAIEALAAGVPVLLPDLGAFPDFVQHGVNGELYSPGDVHALASSMHRLLSDEPKLRMMGQNARRSVEHKYTWDKVTSAIALEITDRIPLR